MENMRYTVGTYVIKTEKKNKGDFICPTCINCKDKSVCSERKNKMEMNKCKLCKNCDDAIHCDKFYINVQNKATLTIGRDLKTKGLIRKSFYGKTQKEAIDKMYKYKFSIEQNIPLADLVNNRFATISTIANEIEESKFRIGKTKANAYNTNMFTLNRIKKNKFANIPIREVTKRQLEDFLEKERVKSNSTIKKDYRMLKNVFDYAKQRKYININLF